jgi:hypothetical protein
VFFSIAGDWNPHYLAVLAPAVAALVGIGVVGLWTAYRSPGWAGWILPVALAVTAAMQSQVLTGYADWFAWLLLTVVMLSLSAIAALVIVRLTPRLWRTGYAPAAVSVGLVALLIVPSLWAASTIWYGGETRTPIAGPRVNGDRGARTEFVRDAAALLSYLQSHKGTATYLVATADRDVAQYAILQTNDLVIATGGFKESDPVLSTTRLAGLVSGGEVRFFLVETPIRRRNATATWINQHCTPIPKETWQPEPLSARREEKGIADQLYDCAGGRGASVGAPALMRSRPPASVT